MESGAKFLAEDGWERDAKIAYISMIIATTKTETGRADAHGEGWGKVREEVRQRKEGEITPWMFALKDETLVEEFGKEEL